MIWSNFFKKKKMYHYLHFLFCFLTLILYVTLRDNMFEYKKSVNLNSYLKFHLQKKACNLTEQDCLSMLVEYIEELSSKRCYRFDRKKEKPCLCFECLRGDPSSQLTVAAHLLEFAE